MLFAPALSIPIFFSKAKRNRLTVSYTAMSSSMLLWSVAKLLEVVSPTAEIKIFYLHVQYGLAVLFIVSIIYFLVQMYFKKVLNKKNLHFLAIGILIIILLIVLYFLKIFMIWPAYMLIMMFSGITLTIFFYRHTLFPEIEISLDGIAEHVEDRVAVFDLNGNLVDMNLCALQGKLIPMEGETLRHYLEKINQYSKQGSLDIDQIALLVDDSYENEIDIELDNITTYYNFSAYVIRNKHGEKLGTVCKLRDITENKLISIELDNKNKELQNLNKELGTYLQIADRLAEEEERANIAREINSTIGQKLTEVLSVLEVIKLTSNKDSDVFEKPLNEAIENCREVLAEIRVVVSRLIPQKSKGGK